MNEAKSRKGESVEPNIDSPVVVILIRHYIPAYRFGGPIRSVAGIANRLSSEIEFNVYCLNSDAGESKPLSGVVSNAWSKRVDATVYYASSRISFLRELLKECRQNRRPFLYLNSFFDPAFSFVPLLLIKFGLIRCNGVILAPRGEFGKAALAKSAWRKRVYMWVCRHLKLTSKVLFQATSSVEESLIVEELRLQTSRVFLMPNCAPVPDRQSVSCRKSANPLRICLVGRVVPIKNILYAIEITKRVRVPVELKIFGPIEDGAYWAKCSNAMLDLPANASVSYRGSVAPELLKEAFSGCDLFFLPTMGENYGHAIVEALSCGLPALISDQTPWTDLDESGAGWAIRLEDEAGFVDVINKFASLSFEARRAMSEAAILYSQRILAKDHTSSIFQAALVRARLFF